MRAQYYLELYDLAMDWPTIRAVHKLRKFKESWSMPWTASDAGKPTHKATTSELQELWAKVANERLEKTGDEGRAIREANSVVAHQQGEAN
jgi:hypothetical protein